MQKILHTMSPRPKRLRRMSKPPVIAGLKPYGITDGMPHNQTIFLHFEEYEAIRLCDVEQMNHADAALEMGISRPTLTRIYASARGKIGRALVQGQTLIIEGGKVYFDSHWFTCAGCGCYFNHAHDEPHPERCALCGSRHISPFRYENPQN